MADLSSGVAVGDGMTEKVKQNQWKAHEYEFFYETKPSTMERMDNMRHKDGLRLLRSYEVFLSFRGQDTRVSFTSHLYMLLFKTKELSFLRTIIHFKAEITFQHHYYEQSKSLEFRLLFSQRTMRSRDGVCKSWWK